MDHLQSLLSPTRAPPLATSDIHLATQSCSLLPVPTSFETPGMEFGGKKLQSRSLTEASSNFSTSEDESGNKRQRYWKKLPRTKIQSNFLSISGDHPVIWRNTPVPGPGDLENFLKAKIWLLLDHFVLSLLRLCDDSILEDKEEALAPYILHFFLSKCCLCSTSTLSCPENSFRVGSEVSVC